MSHSKSSQQGPEAEEAAHPSLSSMSPAPSQQVFQRQGGSVVTISRSYIFSLFAYLFLNAAKTDVEFYEDHAGLKLLAILPSTGVIGMHHQTQVGFFVWFGF